MSNPPPPDLAAALRAALPPELHHLVEPLARYVEATAMLNSLTTDPAHETAITQALTSLYGKAVSSPAGLLSFGAGSQTGDVSTRDVAGRDILHVSIQTVPPAPPTAPGKALPVLDEVGLKVLRAVFEVFGPEKTFRKFSDVNKIMQQAKLPHHVVWPELEVLHKLGLIESYPYGWGDTKQKVRLSAKGFKFLVSLDKGRLP